MLLCNPHNPTGRVFERSELTRLAEIVDRHGARVVADEVHAPLVYPGHGHVPYATVSAAAAEHTVTVTSASKAFNLAGLKCAQIVTTNHADAARWRTLRVFQVAGPTPLGIAASIAAVPIRSAVAGGVGGLPRRQSPTAGGVLGRRTARDRIPPARRDVPGVARLLEARLRRPPPSSCSRPRWP